MYKYIHKGLPWRSSGQDSMIKMQGTWVQSLVRELESHMVCSAAKKKKKHPKEGHIYIAVFKMDNQQGSTV